MGTKRQISASTCKLVEQDDCILRAGTITVNKQDIMVRQCKDAACFSWSLHWLLRCCVGRQEAHPGCKTPAAIIYKGFSFRTGGERQ